MQWSNFATAQQRFSRSVRIPHRCFCFHVGKRIQSRLQLFNPLQIMLSHFLWRNLFVPDFLCERRQRRIVKFRHGFLGNASDFCPGQDNL